MNNNMDTKEMVSALADGRLDARQAASCLAIVARDEAAVQAWQSYHLIGEVLRSAERGALPPSTAFVRRVTQRLSDEIMAEAPWQAGALTPVTEPVAMVEQPMRRRAANDGVFRWKLVAGLASIAAVTAVGWSVLGLGGASSLVSASAATAKNSPVMLSGGERGVMMRDARLDELLAAHQQLGGATALQTPSGFLRNATFDGPGR